MSTHEAQLSLQDWEHKLRNLREETNVRTIAKEISAAQTVRTVKILAYKNGEGRLRPRELICGSTIEGVCLFLLNFFIFFLLNVYNSILTRIYQ